MPTFQSNDNSVPAVDGEHSSAGTAIAGNSVRGMGVHGVNDAPHGATTKPNLGCGVWGESTNGYGVYGSSDNAPGVNGQSVNGNGVNAQTAGRPPLIPGGPTLGYGAFGVLTGVPNSVFVFENSGAGVAGVSTTNTGVLGVSAKGAGVEGHSPTIGVSGQGQTIGVFAMGEQGISALGSKFGVNGQYFNPADTTTCFGFLGGRDPVFNEFAGVYGESVGAGVYGNSNATGGTGVHGRGGGDGGFGVRGEVGNGVAAVQGQSFGSGLAGNFIGGVVVNGHHVVNGNHTVNGVINIGSTGDVVFADCAEDFSVQAAGPRTEPGCVVIMDESNEIRPCDSPYDTRVVGVVSGAGRFRPAITLNRMPESASSAPVALIGKVCCNVDASYAPIHVGDLLTSSATPGFAMKAVDKDAAFGAVIGKALESLAHGRSQIIILVCLQ